MNIDIYYAFLSFYRLNEVVYPWGRWFDEYKLNT